MAICRSSSGRAATGVLPARGHGRPPTTRRLLGQAGGVQVASQAGTPQRCLTETQLCRELPGSAFIPEATRQEPPGDQKHCGATCVPPLGEGCHQLSRNPCRLLEGSLPTCCPLSPRPGISHLRVECSFPGRREGPCLKNK